MRFGIGGRPTRDKSDGLLSVVTILLLLCGLLAVAASASEEVAEKEVR